MAALPGTAQNWIKENLTPETEGCIFWPFGRFADGYGAVELGGKKQRVHRYICAAVHGAPPPGKIDAAHSCGNGHLGCVNSRHLRWATRRENIADAVSHGSWPMGERGSQAKLTNEQAALILSLRGSGRLQKDVAREFGVSRELIGRIWRRQVWAWLDAP